MTPPPFCHFSKNSSDLVAGYFPKNGDGDDASMAIMIIIMIIINQNHVHTLGCSRHRDGDHLVAERAVDVLAAALYNTVVFFLNFLGMLSIYLYI